jgi:pimeloyl-ACP methyl ester carboxylesterase
MTLPTHATYANRLSVVCCLEHTVLSASSIILDYLTSDPWLSYIRAHVNAGWAEANIAFIQSGGYSLSKRIPSVQQECLVVWGRNDKILKPEYAEQFSQVLPKSKLVWVENCGHCPHLEQPQALADCIVDFALSAKAEKVPSSY